MKTCFLAVWAVAASLTAIAAPEHRMRAPDAKTLMLAALDAPDGRAHSVLSSEVADAIGRTFQATSPIYIDVSTVKRYVQRGCARLNVRFWQEGVRLPSGDSGGTLPPRRQTIEFGINYCRDGLPPRALS